MSTYTDGSPFVRLLSNPGRVKIIDVLLRNPTRTLTAGNIADLAGVDPATVYRNSDVLCEMNFMTELEQGSQTLYELNRESESVQALAEANTQLLAETEAIMETTGRGRTHAEKTYEMVKQTRDSDGDDSQTLARRMSVNA